MPDDNDRASRTFDLPYAAYTALLNKGLLEPLGYNVDNQPYYAEYVKRRQSDFSRLGCVRCVVKADADN